MATSASGFLGLAGAGPQPVGATAVCPVGSLEAGDVCQVWYRTTGHSEVFTVPDGVANVRLLAKGGDGGMGTNVGIPVGPTSGGVVGAALAVVGGDQLVVVAGGRGASATNITGSAEVPGGFGGGGSSCAVLGSGGGGGGGGSFVFRRDPARSLVLAAGGAGGAGSIEMYGVPDVGGIGGGDGPGGTPPMGASASAPGSGDRDQWAVTGATGPTDGSGPARLDAAEALVGSVGGHAWCGVIYDFQTGTTERWGSAGGGGGGGLYAGGGGSVRMTAHWQGDHYEYVKLTTGGGGGSGTIAGGATSATVTPLGAELDHDGAVIVQYDPVQIPTTTTTTAATSSTSVTKPVDPATSSTPPVPASVTSSTSTTALTSTSTPTTSTPTVGPPTTPAPADGAPPADDGGVVVRGAQADSPATVRPYRNRTWRGTLARTGSPIWATAATGLALFGAGLMLLLSRHRLFASR